MSMQSGPLVMGSTIFPPFHLLFKFRDRQLPQNSFWNHFYSRDVTQTDDENFGSFHLKMVDTCYAYTDRSSQIKTESVRAYFHFLFCKDAQSIKKRGALLKLPVDYCSSKSGLQRKSSHAQKDIKKVCQIPCELIEKLSKKIFELSCGIHDPVGDVTSKKRSHIGITLWPTHLSSPQLVNAKAIYFSLKWIQDQAMWIVQQEKRPWCGERRYHEIGPGFKRSYSKAMKYRFTGRLRPIDFVYARRLLATCLQKTPEDKHSLVIPNCIVTVVQKMLGRGYLTQVTKIQEPNVAKSQSCIIV